jgi:predicted ATPase/class 3 adenylate cyclase
MQSPDELPSGTVTFVFTDIEGSTRLLRHLGQAYTRVQDDHAAIMRKTFDEEDGIVIRTEGDSFFAVFRSPIHAVRAVIAAQRRLAGHEWTHGAPLLVRMGLHTGEGAEGGDDYLGIDVNRAARIAAAAHGGQILVSDATRVLVEDALGGDVELLDLGEHRLKDFDRPVRLFQLTLPELRTSFPPPRTLEVPTNLPPERTAFIGRDRELAALVQLVRERRLVTLTGPGGTGKTRLAVRAAAGLLRESPGGVFLVDLAPIWDPGLVPSTIAGTLGIREDPARPVEETLVDHLRTREILLVLDNFEQIIEAAPIVGSLLDGAPRIKTIVTSRAPLRLSAEQEFPVPPLAVPHDGAPEPDNVSGYESVALFVERASAVDPSFALTKDNASVVAEICRRLDGLPLAIELAASRVRMLPAQTILQRLEQHLPVLKTAARDVPERQRTLESTISWSHDLLGSSERALFRRLAVFVGGWTLERAEEIANPDEELGFDTLEGLDLLGENSLVQRLVSDEELRFGMLETIREYGLEQLGAAREIQELRRRHSTAFLNFAERAEAGVYGRDSRAWLDRVEREHDNLRSALAWMIEAGRPEEGMRLGAALWRFWQIRDHLAEGRQWMEDLLHVPGAEARSAPRAKALLAAGSLAYWQEDMETAEQRYEESLEISRQLRDRKGVAEALFNLAFPHAVGGRLDSAHRFLVEARRTFEEMGDDRQAAFATAALAMTPFMAGEISPAQSEKSLALAREARARFQAIGDVFGTALANGILGLRCVVAGDLEEARARMTESLDGYLEVGDLLGATVVVDGTALMAAKIGHHEVSVRLAGASSVLRETARGGAPPPLLILGDPRELAKGALSSDQIDAAFDAGRGLGVEATIALTRRELAAGDDGLP